MSGWVSPMYADLRGLPPMLIHAGDHEVLLDDAVRRRARGPRRGRCSDSLWPGMMHVFQNLAPFVPEANRANRQIVDFIRTRTAAD